MVVLSERNGGTNDITEVEDGPKNGDELALLALSRIRQHERALSSPEQSSANAEESSGDDDERTCIVMNIDSPEQVLEMVRYAGRQDRRTNKIRCKVHNPCCQEAA
jgi:hypothetical protein